MTTEDFKITSATPLCELVQDLLTINAFWESAQAPLHAHFEPGHPRVLFVAGENCSGKSYFVESLRAWGKAFIENGTTISVSIRERVGSGQFDMAGMRKLMMFGDEDEQSTGATSVGVIERAFDNLVGRADEKKKTLLVLDEPELGLSDGYACAMGSYLAQRIASMPEPTAGVVIVSHSRPLALALMEGIGGAAPSFVHMSRPLSFLDWAHSTELRTVAELLALQETGHTLSRLIRSVTEELLKT